MQDIIPLNTIVIYLRNLGEPTKYYSCYPHWELRFVTGHAFAPDGKIESYHISEIYGGVMSIRVDPEFVMNYDDFIEKMKFWPTLHQSMIEGLPKFIELKHVDSLKTYPVATVAEEKH